MIHDASCSSRWVQIRKQDDRGTTGSFIGFHWDKDEDLVDCSGICLHPQLSTVTYLCATGAPTMICDRTSPLQYDDHDELHSPANDFVRAFISHPDCRTHECPPDNSGAAAALKHVAFDGRMLHSAPHEFTRPSCLPQQQQPAKDETGAPEDSGRCATTSLLLFARRETTFSTGRPSMHNAVHNTRHIFTGLPVTDRPRQAGRQEGGGGGGGGEIRARAHTHPPTHTHTYLWIVMSNFRNIVLPQLL